MNKANPIEVQSFLKDAAYPMERDALIILAEGNDAPEHILESLESLPDVDFESVVDLQEALGDVQDFPRNEQSNSQKTERTTSQRSRKREIEERKRQLKEETGKLTEPGKTVNGEPDHRLKGQETEALRSARHMEHGYDGRGQITDPKMDARLAENRAKDEEEPKEEKPKRSTWRSHSKSKNK